MQGREKNNKGDCVSWALTHPYKDVHIIKLVYTWELGHWHLLQQLEFVEGGWRMHGKEKSNKGDYVWWVLAHPNKDKVLVIKNGMYMENRPFAFTLTTPT